MKNDEFNNLNDKELLRLTGIKQAIFNKMLDILQGDEIEKFFNFVENSWCNKKIINMITLKENYINF